MAISEFRAAINQVATERGISALDVLDSVRLALAKAYVRDFGGSSEEIKVELDEETGESRIFDLDGKDMGWADNKQFAGIYLNSQPDYEGGVLKFRDHNLDVIPQTGTFLSFPGGMENIHSVTEVTAGTRYTIVIFWDYADAWYSEAELKEMERLIIKERIHQYQLKERWKEGEAHPVLDDPYVGLDNPDLLPAGFKESLTTADIKSNARRNQENAIKEGKVPEGVVIDMELPDDLKSLGI